MSDSVIFKGEEKCSTSIGGERVGGLKVHLVVFKDAEFKEGLE